MRLCQIYDSVPGTFAKIARRPRKSRFIVVSGHFGHENFSKCPGRQLLANHRQITANRQSIANVLSTRHRPAVKVHTTSLYQWQASDGCITVDLALDSVCGALAAFLTAVRAFVGPSVLQRDVFVVLKVNPADSQTRLPIGRRGGWPAPHPPLPFRTLFAANPPSGGATSRLPMADPIEGIVGRCGRGEHRTFWFRWSVGKWDVEPRSLSRT